MEVGFCLKLCRNYGDVEHYTEMPVFFDLAFYGFLPLLYLPLLF